MTYSTMMVTLSCDHTNACQLGIAAELAERFEARVIGIAASDISPPLYFTSGDQAERLLEHGLAAIRQRLGEVEAEFRQAMGGHARELQWRSAIDQPAKYIVQQARAADIVISRAAGPLTDPFALADPADLVMQIGRPLLVVPDDNCRVDLSSVLVAWKDNPEARRAIVNALPLLRQASHVTVVEIVEHDGSRADALAGVHDVVDWLSRHHIHATGEVPAPAGDVARQLDTVATQVRAGIVVAGAYGHSRFREWILGGVTQHLIEQTARCALLAR
ncbi:universal stress protein [Rhodopseudomonas pseudopalustris]|uniref:UspA n=2 Tax=Rhodopseudomonas TaxID=1073 RepID=Q13BF5_RHOPS|nr:universal stress protein [Rhodopseudomonas pseudopalustris]ABE38584.1 UspA [Rhodopseudomonas palustris BisB5]MBB1091806.1 universal stress protein [Rhodopseudomonas palustris]SEO35532.1 Nucleotide-binding universal stress protein, UspA family [Rhodopseudomonas pseudopalustris]